MVDKRQWVLTNRAALKPYRDYLYSKYIDIREQDLNNIHDERITLIDKGKALLLRELISELEIKQENN